jgi:hypothetical protein
MRASTASTRDPGTLAKNNLDGNTERPGFHQDGLGTVEVPGLALH